MARRFVGLVVAVVTWVFSRRHVAGGLMSAGVAAGVVGSYLEWGGGVSMLVAAGLLIPLSIIVGWE